MAEQSGKRGASVRVSDAEREEAAGVLREHCGDGRLTLDELSERLEATFAARTREELSLVLTDLPALPTQAPGPLATQAHPEARRRRPTGWAVAVLANSSHQGRWRPKPVTNVISLMGCCDLDLRQAEVEGPELVINAVNLMGNIDIIVPEGIEVELTGINIMGCKDRRLSQVPPIPGGPLVLVRAIMLMGNVTVRSKRGQGDGATQDDRSSALGPGPGFAGGAWMSRELLRSEGLATRPDLDDRRRARRARRHGWQ
ncbi:MAG: DUF1707 SHOCT-like domain-containing protein [Acidimicrobiales bacterium]